MFPQVRIGLKKTPLSPTNSGRLSSYGFGHCLKAACIVLLGAVFIPLFTTTATAGTSVLVEAASRVCIWSFMQMITSGNLCLSAACTSARREGRTDQAFKGVRGVSTEHLLIRLRAPRRTSSHLDRRGPWGRPPRATRVCDQVANSARLQFWMISHFWHPTAPQERWPCHFKQMAIH